MCALTYCELCYSGDFKNVLEPSILGVKPNVVQQLKTAPIFENVYKNWVGKPKQPKSEDIKQMYRPQIYYEVSLLALTFTDHLLVWNQCELFIFTNMVDLKLKEASISLPLTL